MTPKKTNHTKDLKSRCEICLNKLKDTRILAKDYDSKIGPENNIVNATNFFDTFVYITNIKHGLSDVDTNVMIDIQNNFINQVKDYHYINQRIDLNFNNMEECTKQFFNTIFDILIEKDYYIKNNVYNELQKLINDPNNTINELNNTYTFIIMLYTRRLFNYIYVMYNYICIIKQYNGFMRESYEHPINHKIHGEKIKEIYDTYIKKFEICNKIVINLKITPNKNMSKKYLKYDSPEIQKCKKIINDLKCDSNNFISSNDHYYNKIRETIKETIKGPLNMNNLKTLVCILQSSVLETENELKNQLKIKLINTKHI